MADYNSSLTGDQIEQTLMGAVLSNKEQRLTEEQKAQARKNIGAGTSDSGLRILGYYQTADQMAASVANPKAGDAYAVGIAAPYDIYIWDAVHRSWVNNGNIRGADGKDADLSDAEPMKHKFTDVRIVPAAYVADETYPDFPFRAAIPLEGINETMTPYVTFDVAEAIGGMFAPVAACYNGGVYIYAESALNYEIIIPTIICWEGVYAVDDPTADKLIISYDDLRALVQSEVDAAGEAATQAQTYAEQAKSYADEAKTGNVADGAVTVKKIAPGAVTRDKLANDAKYSPRNMISTENYSIVASDGGKTIWPTGTAASLDIVITLSQSVSSAMPVDAEIALLWMYGKSFTLQSDGVRLAMVGESSFFKTGVKITKRFGMISLKKMAPDGKNGDLWLVQGLAEMVP